ncbi:MAG: hypothetical protein ABJA60_09720 [Nitrosospira sp.]
MDPCLYIRHPCETTIPGFEPTVSDFKSAAGADERWRGWQLSSHVYDKAGSLVTRNLCAQVLAAPGPVIFINPVQQSVIAAMRLKLNGRVSVLVRDAYDLDTLANCSLEAKELHDSGAPRIPRNKAVALLLVRKLEREHMWAGNAKGYMWGDDLHKGRGMDEQFASQIPLVSNILLQHEVLTSKVSMSSKKYALNPDHRAAIMEMLRIRKFGDALEKVLLGDKIDISARDLDLLNEYDTPQAD